VTTGPDGSEPASVDVDLTNASEEAVRPLRDSDPAVAVQAPIVTRAACAEGRAHPQTKTGRHGHHRLRDGLLAGRSSRRFRAAVRPSNRHGKPRPALSIERSLPGERRGP